jgi:3-phenylpropionate/trans-cinnamate dioxygenase ferredoxin subunit
VSTTREREARLPLRDAPAEGDVRLVEVAGHRLGLFRVGDRLHALADRCPHRGAPICSGRVTTPIEVDGGRLRLGRRASVLRCPWHKWEFEIATGRCLVDERLLLRRYAVRVEGDEIVVSLDRPSS